MFVRPSASRSGNSSATATRRTPFDDLIASCTAPVPRPPAPIRPMRISSLPAAHAPVMLACAAASAPAATDADLMKVRRVTEPGLASGVVSGIVPWSSLAIAASVVRAVRYCP